MTAALVTNPIKPEDQGAEIGTLANAQVIHGGHVTLVVPEMHQFYAKIASVESAYAQGALLQYWAENTPYDNRVTWVMLGGDGNVGKTPTEFYSEGVVTSRSNYQFWPSSFFFGDSKPASGIRITAKEYEKGIAVRLEIDDAGRWAHGAGPDGDYNDLILDVWVANRGNKPTHEWGTGFSLSG